MIKACIFDLDGTLCDTLTTIAYFANKALEHFELATIEENEYKYMIGNGYKNLIKKMLEYLGVYTEDLFNKVAEYYFEIYDKNPLYLTAPYPGIEDMLDRMSERGIKTAVLSNKPHNATQNVVEKILKDKKFSHVQGNIENVPLKPSPEPLIYIMEEIGVISDECLYIGDTPTDIQTGKNALVKTVGVTWGFRTEKELVDAGADYIVSSPAEIVELL